ncbi:beta-ketoadipyl CoA thiolase [Roseovarius atlanticus]|uniref:3-oxoadipyl-CoA thiolase n=2 Tax=Roseovarius atlanticus TaxID=1641875 RepID=A0A0T5NQA2_9RHOB|nr:3-oxoadipyl-CoA thiolase [Roseovarius atlanticus]KRS11107.1 beta-ketoadipyl CoA thiolase [Roseovarius atlanticus]
MMDAFLVDYIRTPIGRYGGALSSIRPDDLGANVLRQLLARHGGLPADRIDEVVLGCSNQAGEDNRNVARMATLLAGLPETLPALTVNRLCASGLAAVNIAANKIKTGEAELMIAGGVESMSRAPFIMPKAEQAFSRASSVEDTTIGWRMVNPRMKAEFGIESMPETAENVAEDFAISREDQDAFAARSQARAANAQASGRFAKEIIPVTIPQRRGDDVVFDHDEHPRETTVEILSKLKTPFRQGGSVTAGNSSGVNDGAAATLIASAAACEAYGLTPRARILSGASAGVAPRVMGIGPVSAVQKLVDRLGLSVKAFDVIELNEAFASQSLAVLRGLGLPDDADHVNPNGGAIALGHPLGMSGTRLVGTALIELEMRQAQRALATMCVGVGQGEALAIERVSA